MRLKIILLCAKKIKGVGELAIPGDEVLLDLLETNIRQRGIGNPNPVKLGRCIKELERIYGVREGRPEKLPNSSVVKSQSDLAAQMDISVDTLQNYKMLADMIPELDELVTTGIVTKTTALALMRNLSDEEQKELIQALPTDKKYTQKQMDEEIQKYKNRISELIQKGTKTEIITKEVDKPETIKKIQVLQNELDEKINKSRMKR